MSLAKQALPDSPLPSVPPQAGETVSDAELARIVELDKAATCWPWEVIPDLRPDVMGKHTIWSVIRKGGYENGGHVGQTTIIRQWASWFDYFGRVIESIRPDIGKKKADDLLRELREKRPSVFEQSKQYSENDAELIAALRNAAPSLLSELVSLRAQLATAEAKYESAEFWKDWVYPEGATAQQVQDELYDYRVVLENVSEVYSHITHSRISKPNTRAREVIAVSDDLEREAIEEETKDLQEQLDTLMQAQPVTVSAEAELGRELIEWAARNAQSRYAEDFCGFCGCDLDDAEPKHHKDCYHLRASALVARRGTVAEAGEEK